jgi:hypothetical protein
MVGVSQEDQSRKAQGSSTALNCRQLRHSQVSEIERVAGKTQTFPHALRPELQLVDEHGRAFSGQYGVFAFGLFQLDA